MTPSTELKEGPALKVITAAGTKSEADLSLFMFFVSAGGGRGGNSAALSPSGSVLYEFRCLFF